MGRAQFGTNHLAGSSYLLSESLKGERKKKALTQRSDDEGPETIRSKDLTTEARNFRRRDQRGKGRVQTELPFDGPLVRG